MTKLLSALCLLVGLPVFAQNPIMRNSWSTNVAGTAVRGQNNLSITNLASGTNWNFYGISSDTVARLADVNNVAFWFTNTAAVSSISNAYSIQVPNSTVTSNINWTGGRVAFVPITGNIQTYVNAALPGDTLILGSGTYTITSAITVTNAINILGQGSMGFVTSLGTASHGTRILATTVGITGFQINTNNVRVSNLSIDLTGAGSTAINTTTNLYGLSFSEIDAIVTCNATAQGFTIYGSDATLRNMTFYVYSTNSAAYGVYLWNDGYCTNNNTVELFNVSGTVKGGATAAYGVTAEATTAKNLTLNVYNSVIVALTGTALDAAVASIGAAGTASVNCFLSTLDGADWDSYQSGANLMALGGSVLANNRITGTPTYRATMVSGSVLATNVTVGRGTPAPTAMLQVTSTNNDPVNAFAVRGTNGYLAMAVVSTNGTVGIGTNYPSGVRMHVFNPTNTMTRALKVEQQSVGTVTTSPLMLKLTNPQAAISGTFGPGLQFAVEDTNVTETLVGRIALQNNSNGTNYDMGFSVNSVSREVMRLKSEGTVSIGTTISAAKLQVTTTNGDPENAFAVRQTNGLPAIVVLSTNGNVGIGTNTSSMFSVRGDGVKAISEWFSSAGNYRVYIDAAGNLVSVLGLDSGSTASALPFKQGGTERMRIDATTGNIGIGTNAPQSKLHIADLSTNSDPALCIANDLQNWRMRVYGSGYDQFQIYDVNNAKAPLSIAPNCTDGTLVLTNGNVGIGTAIPSYSLDIGGASGMKFMRINGSATSGAFVLIGNGNTNVGGFGNSSAYLGGAFDNTMGFMGWNGLTFWTANQNRMIITAAGSVGIGTNAPQSKLHIADLSTNSDPAVCIANDVQSWRTRVYGTGYDQFQVFDVVNSLAPFSIVPNCGANTLVLSNGWAGVNTAYPLNQLDVNGTTLIRGAVTALSTANFAGAVNSTNGYAVGAAVGLTTNINVIIAGPLTNQLQFTKGILTGVVPVDY